MEVGGGLQPALGNFLLAALDSLPVVGSFEGIGHVVEYTLRIVEDGTRQVEAAEHLALADNLHIVVGSLQVVVGSLQFVEGNLQDEESKVPAEEDNHLAVVGEILAEVRSLQVVVGEALAEVQTPQGEQNHQSCPFSESHSCLSFYYLL